MSLEQIAHAYYEDPNGLALPIYEATREGVDRGVTPAFHHSEHIDQAAVTDKLHEISRTLMVVEYGGSYFEIGVANQEAPDDDVMLHISTFSSSISGNLGNAYEFAAQAVRYPNKRQIYVASYGNGGTSRLLTSKERRYAARTGRFTWERDNETVPLPSITNMLGAFEKAGLGVTRIIGSDSAGGSYAEALSLAMNEGQLTHVFFSEKSGFVNLSVPRIIGGIVVKEGVINRKKNQAVSNDPQKMSEEKIKHAEEVFASYADLPSRQELAEHIVRTPTQLLTMWTSMQALRRGPRFGRNPLVTETNHMLKRHPQLLATFGVAERDPLYKNPVKAHTAAQQFLGKLTLRGKVVRVVMIPEMTHAYNTDFPSLNHALKRYALELQDV